MGKKKGKNLEELKQELEMDDHKVPVDELCKRYNSDPDKVEDASVYFQNRFSEECWC